MTTTHTTTHTTHNKRSRSPINIDTYGGRIIDLISSYDPITCIGDMPPIQIDESDAYHIISNTGVSIHTLL